MNCQEFEQLVTGLAEGQLMDAATRARAVAHATECPRCDRRWQGEQVLSVGLRAFAASTAEAEAPARLKQALRAVFDEQAQSAPSVVVPFPARAQRWPRWALAAAAALLVIIGVAALVWLRGAAPQREHIVVSTNPSPTPTPEPHHGTVAPQPDKVIAHAAPKPANRPKRMAPPAPQAEQANEKEVAAQFIPLGYAGNSSQDGLVVRVEVSRASLIAMGLPLDASRAEGNVKADLKVGVNGLPLAIRLLQ
jgi:hypothetical protein